MRAVYPRLEPELGRLAEFVPAGGTAVDVGGWFGPWTARLLRRADRVVAIEADPELAALLRRTFPSAQVVQAACSAAAGETELWIPPNRLAGLSSVEQRIGRPVTVPKITLDAIDLADVRFLKLDIEGHELAALQGGEDTIRRDRPVVLLELEERHQPIAPVVELLGSWGYAGSVLQGGGWVRLADFPLAERQRATLPALDRALLRRVVRPEPRYPNSVLFRPVRGWGAVRRP